MANLDPIKIWNQLVNGPLHRLDQLPRSHGIYALWDHEGAVQYVGITEREKYGFHGRINNRHVTGSEGRSHKFSHAYNTGRMWRLARDSGPDAKLAKALRTCFIRLHCTASFVIITDVSQQELGKVELMVQAIAPKGTLTWGNKRAVSPVAEPKSLVDALIDKVGYTSFERAALARQASLFRSLQANAAQ